MKIKIKETGEIKELKHIDSKGQDWSDNITKSEDVIKEGAIYTASEDTYKWWAWVIK